MESKVGMKPGRPWSAQLSQLTCTSPADDLELALLSGSNFAFFDENVTWLSYTVQNTKLVLAARAIYIAFYDRCADIVGVNGGESLYDHPELLETCAEFLLSGMKCLQNWLHKVPDALKTNRKGGGVPFSTDGSALDAELFAPLWLQRQRLMLELLYHDLAMNLYRPFICFSAKPNSCTPLVEGNAISCVNHAMAITYIIRQMLTETEILRGWHEMFQGQWNATLSMVGFILAYPVAPSTPLAHKAINSAMNVFEKFGSNFTVAISAADVAPDLTTKADFLIDRFMRGLNPSFSNDIGAFERCSSPDPNNNPMNSSGVVSQLDEESSVIVPNPFADSIFYNT